MIPHLRINSPLTFHLAPTHKQNKILPQTLLYQINQRGRCCYFTMTKESKPNIWNSETPQQSIDATTFLNEFQ